MENHLKMYIYIQLYIYVCLTESLCYTPETVNLNKKEDILPKKGSHQSPALFSEPVV